MTDKNCKLIDSIITGEIEGVDGAFHIICPLCGYMLSLYHAISLKEASALFDKSHLNSHVE